MRETIDHIVEKRRKRKNVIFLTGGTGFVGSHLAVELLKKGYSIILLSRQKRDLDAFERVQQILRWHNYPYNENLKVINGQITEPQLGLAHEVYAYLLESIDEIWHCAADTSFSESKRKQIEKVNVYGTLNVLKLAVESKCYFFHHMSSSFVAGKSHGVCKEEYVPQEEFYNVYEETKHKAEGYVLETCIKEGIRANIYRPSIIYGDSRTGKTLLFNALYLPIRLSNFFKELYERNNGLNAEKMGVRKTEDGKIYLPIRIGKVENASINLVPINFVVEGSIAIMENCLDGGIFHVINRNPSKIEDLIISGAKFMDTQGVKVVPENEFVSYPKNALERMTYSYIKAYLDMYQPYFFDDRIFDARNAKEILERNNIVCPYLDYEVFSRCARYAIEMDWGKKLFRKEEEK